MVIQGRLQRILQILQSLYSKYQAENGRDYGRGGLDNCLAGDTVDSRMTNVVVIADLNMDADWIADWIYVSHLLSIHARSQPQ